MEIWSQYNITLDLEQSSALILKPIAITFILLPT